MFVKNNSVYSNRCSFHLIYWFPTHTIQFQSFLWGGLKENKGVNYSRLTQHPTQRDAAPRSTTQYNASQRIACTHGARTHACTHARTHARTHAWATHARMSHACTHSRRTHARTEHGARTHKPRATSLEPHPYNLSRELRATSLEQRPYIPSHEPRAAYGLLLDAYVISFNNTQFFISTIY